MTRLLMFFCRVVCHAGQCSSTNLVEARLDLVAIAVNIECCDVSVRWSLVTLASFILACCHHSIGPAPRLPNVSKTQCLNGVGTANRQYALPLATCYLPTYDSCVTHHSL